MNHRKRDRDVLDIGGRVDRHPYGMVAGAIGVGFVLGGGIFTRLGAELVGGGLRLGLAAALPLLQDELARAARPAIEHSKLEVKKGERR